MQAGQVAAAARRLPCVIRIQVWDLRQRRCVYTIPAHTSLVASCSYERGCGGAYLVTGGYDCMIKVRCPAVG